jgi:AraC-like DNA-binding protein
LATLAKLSLSHFSRAFKATFGVSPVAYIAERRIELAKRLLSETTTSLADIALTCGFADQAHFSNRFRQVAGDSPSRWRRQHATAWQLIRLASWMVGRWECLLEGIRFGAPSWNGWSRMVRNLHWPAASQTVFERLKLSTLHCIGVYINHIWWLCVMFFQWAIATQSQNELSVLFGYRTQNEAKMFNRNFESHL